MSVNASFLYLKRLSKTDSHDAKSLMRDWSASADQILEAMQKNDRITRYNGKMVARIECCRTMSEQVRATILRFDWSNKNREIYLCHDKENNWLSIMVIEINKNSISIDQLVSNPRNLVPRQQGAKCGRDAPVKGAGSTLVIRAISRAIELNKGTVYLRSLPDAVLFYESLGFSSDPVQPPGTCQPMRITAEKIRDMYLHLMNGHKAA